MTQNQNDQTNDLQEAFRSSLAYICEFTENLTLEEASFLDELAADRKKELVGRIHTAWSNGDPVESAIELLRTEMSNATSSLGRVPC